jgi:hypothetical protein
MILNFDKFIKEHYSLDDIWKTGLKHDGVMKGKYYKYLINKYYSEKTLDKAGDVNTKYIYHCTILSALERILETNIFKAGYMMEGEKGICFSSDADLYKKGFYFSTDAYSGIELTDKTCGIQIKVDFEAIKNDGYDYIVGSGDEGTSQGENEIRILGSTISSARKYITMVYLYPTKLAAMGESLEDAKKLLDSKMIKYRLRA